MKSRLGTWLELRPSPIYLECASTLNQPPTETELAPLAHLCRLGSRLAAADEVGFSMKALSQLGPVVFASLVPALVYSAVLGLSTVITVTDTTLIAWVALVLAAMLVWWAADEYLVQRETTVAAMKRFGQTFVREFERPLLQTSAAERPIQSQLRAIPDRRRLEIFLSPCGDHRYPNLADHRTNVLYDVARVLELVRDQRFVCQPVYSQGSWVVVPFQFRMSAKQAGDQ